MYNPPVNNLQLAIVVVVTTFCLLVFVYLPRSNFAHILDFYDAKVCLLVCLLVLCRL